MIARSRLAWWGCALASCAAMVSVACVPLSPSAGTAPLLLPVVYKTNRAMTPTPPVPSATPSTTPQPWRVLVFSRTLGYRHDSIAAGLTLIRQLGRDHGFGVDASEDPATFSDSGLAPYAAVVFLSTTGDVLDAGQQAAFERFIRAGRGYVGVHSAADTEYDWAWYGGLMGAYFQDHPPGLHTARLVVEDRSHVSTAHLDATWERTDEWYNFRTNPRPTVNVLITLDESTYTGGTMGSDHPIAWYHAYDGGRAWYTGLGHTAETYAEPAFIQHLLGGIRWASGR